MIRREVSLLLIPVSIMQCCYLFFKNSYQQSIAGGQSCNNAIGWMTLATSSCCHVCVAVAAADIFLPALHPKLAPKTAAPVSPCPTYATVHGSYLYSYVLVFKCFLKCVVSTAEKD